MTSPTMSDSDTRLKPRIASTVLLLLLLVLFTSVPFWAGRSETRLLMEAFSFLALAQMWNLLAGYTGLVSVGQQAYVGLGAYLFFALAIYSGLPVLAAMPIAALLTGLLSLPIGWVAFRLKGAYFAIGSWVLAEVFRLIAAQVGALGGGSGISLPIKIAKSMANGRAEREMMMYYIAFAIAVISILGVWICLRSRWGLALTAIRDSEPAAEAMGVATRRTKFLIYIITAMMTGMTGAFIFLQKLRITPEAAFSVTDWTAFVIFIVVIGGIGTIEGPIIGVILFFTMRELAADWGSWYLILMGSIAIGVMLIDSRGIWGALKARYGWDLFPVRRIL